MSKQSELGAVNLQEICKHGINVALSVCHRCDGTAIYTERDLNKRIEDVLERLGVQIDYNKHDFGDMGEFIRIKYVDNLIEAERKKLKADPRLHYHGEGWPAACTLEHKLKESKDESTNS